MAFRTESPSSINTFKQCKRKYYFQYIEKHPTYPTIHTVRGNIAHTVLEDFYDIDVSSYKAENYQLKFKTAIQQLLISTWKKYNDKLQELQLPQDQQKFYFEETMVMLMNWTNQFIKTLQNYMRSEEFSLQEAFAYLTPIRENEFRSEQHSVRGFIDAIHHVDGQTHIVDYKTNKNPELKDSIKLQLAIYALLYEELEGKLPDKVGIFFLREKLHMLPVEEHIVEKAKEEISKIHAHTSSTQDINDYPRTVTGLCKWRTGQCSFYEICKPHG